MPVNPLTLTTELEAVNMMLRAIGESGVTTIDEPTHEDAAQALATLRHWNMTVQEEGWRFNKREKVLLTRNGSNHILVPNNTLSIELNRLSATSSASYIEGKLFDLQTNTYVWDHDLYVDYTLIFPFEVIPQSARNYITQMAGLQYVGTDASSEARTMFSKEQAAIARAALRRTESLIRKPNMLTDSYHAAKFFVGRRQFTPS